MLIAGRNEIVKIVIKSLCLCFVLLVRLQAVLGGLSGCRKYSVMNNVYNIFPHFHTETHFNNFSYFLFRQY